MYARYRAILILTNRLSQAERRAVDASLLALPRMSRPRIKEHLARLEPKLQELQRFVGARGTLRQMEELIEGHPAEQRHTLLFVSKPLLQRLFSHYERRFPAFATLPPHALIGIDVYGIRDDALPVTYQLLEASLFEDMAALWNEALQRATTINPHAQYGNEAIKLYGAILRATAKAAFNLLEGYVNGIALDILLTRQVDAATRTKLEEWDATRTRPRYLSLRDKLLHYPRIALDVVHPPLQETNCPELNLVLQLEDQLRNALIHPKPRADPKDPTRNRLQAYFDIELERVRELCDATLVLIEKINVAIDEMFGKTSEWLTHRGSDGRFGPHTFH